MEVIKNHSCMSSQVLYECFVDNKVQLCSIIQKCKKNKYGEDRYFVSIGNNQDHSILLRAANINLQDSDEWRRMMKQKIESNIRKQIVQEIDEFLSGSSYNEPIIDEQHRKALQKNERLSKILHDKRETMCGLGTRKVKLLLNKRIKEGDKIAELYRKAIEVEDCNIRAKETVPYYKGKVYRQKHSLLMELVELCEKMGVTYGKQMTDGRETNCIIYFELPGVEQISFHTSLEPSDALQLPDYGKEWDGKQCSTLRKLEDAINERYYNKPYDNSEKSLS